MGLKLICLLLDKCYEIGYNNIMFESTKTTTYYNNNINNITITGPPISLNPYLVKNATHRTLMWSPPFLWPGQRIQQYNISLFQNNERVEHRMLDTSSTNTIITVTFPQTSSLLQFNTQNNMLSCMPLITFSILPVDGPTWGPMQTFNISDWAWTFPSGNLCLQLA